MGKLSRFIFWDFKRGSWQYDVVVLLILLFIFKTPRDFFHDQPKAASVSMLPAEQGAGLFWIDPQQLAGVPADQLIPRASALVSQRYKNHDRISRVAPIYDEEQDITGYIVYTHP